jgi:predicted double-glycine peptidase
MVADLIGVRTDKTIEDIAETCGTHYPVGTDDKMMEKGFAILGMTYRIPSNPNVNYLIKSLEAGNVIIVRTLTRGAKHWIVAYAYANGQFAINDPWLGEIKYTEQELIDIWKPRNFFCFEIPAGRKNAVLNMLRFTTA